MTRLWNNCHVLTVTHLSVHINTRDSITVANARIFLVSQFFSQRQLIIEAYRQCACDVTIAASNYSCCSSCRTPLVKPQLMNATILYSLKEFLTLMTLTNIPCLSLTIFFFLSLKFKFLIVFYVEFNECTKFCVNILPSFAITSPQRVLWRIFNFK